MNKNDFPDVCDKDSLCNDLSLSETDIAWLAGLLEGEGSFRLDDRPSKRYLKSTAPPAPVMKVSMTDKDIIERVSKMLKKDYYQASRKTTGNKTEYIVSCQVRSILIYLLPQLLPYFGERRSAQVKKCIDALEDWKKWDSERSLRKASKGVDHKQI